MTPIRGGPTRQGEADSRPLANIAFEVKENGQVIKSFQTDERGQFHVELKPGQYTIARKDWKEAIGFYGPFEVEITQGKMTKVKWKCDSGLR
jgi:Prealbumin-like fold domain